MFLPLGQLLDIQHADEVQTDDLLGESARTLYNLFHLLIDGQIIRQTSHDLIVIGIILPQHLQNNVRFGIEIDIERPFGHAGFTDNLVHRDPVKSALAEQLHRTLV